MVRNCPCKGRKCKCNMDGAGGITFTGSGTDRLPYQAHWSLFSLVAGDTEQADVTITGSGTSGDPWVVSIATLGGSVTQTVYESDDTWDKPSAGSVAQVVVIGGGGGGGTAARAGSDAGGSGGSGGAMSVGLFLLDDLADSVDVEVGQGGSGARPIEGQTTGGDGGRSFFGTHLLANGGKGGKSQVLAAQTQHTTVGGTPPEGGPGGAGSVRSNTFAIGATKHDTFVSPTGGGMGEGQEIEGSVGGELNAGLSWAGVGGDGGNLMVSDGKPGGKYGGGGGGGASTLFFTDSKGGNGAPGVVVVTVW